MAGKSGKGATSNNILSPTWTRSPWSDVKANVKGVIKR